ncbi:MAG: hypothetical protein ACRCZF_10455 [Gemmataceae bacterium]
MRRFNLLGHRPLTLSSLTLLGVATASLANPPAKMPEPLPINSVPVAVAAPAAPLSPVVAAPCSTGACDSGSYEGGHFSNMHARSADRKAVWAGAKSCAAMPAKQMLPIGTWTREAFSQQVSNALADYLVIYDIEWERGTADLNGYGTRHLDGISRRLGGHSHPIKIESSGNQSLDEMRRAAVASQVVKCGLDAAAAGTRVVVGSSRAEHLRYEEIESIYSRGFNRNGNSGGGSGGGFGGGAGGGFGGFGR